MNFFTKHENGYSICICCGTMTWHPEEHRCDGIIKAALVEALEGIGADYPDGQKCFCDMAVGNPMCTDHSTRCKVARAALITAKDKKDK